MSLHFFVISSPLGLALSRALLFLLVFSAALTSAPGFAKSGGGGGIDAGGGTSCELEFKKIARAIHLALLRNKLTLVEPIAAKEFWTAYETTTVQPVEHDLFLEGEKDPRDAINHPTEKRIDVNVFRWETISSEARKFQLVFHEYLGIMKKNDKDGRISDVYLVDFKGRPKPEAFRARSGSVLSRYDQDAASLAKLSAAKDVRRSATEILQGYFGFDEVRFASKDADSHDTRRARQLALSLRHSLPANLGDEYYMGLKQNISAKPPSPRGLDLRGRFVREGQVIRRSIRFDAREPGVNFRQSVEREGKNEVLRCEITYGGGRLEFSPQLKIWMATLLNCGELYFVPNVDVDRF